MRRLTYPKGVNILLLGSGGREHAIARALSGDPSVSTLVIAPGNPGMAALGDLVAVDVLDGRAVADLAASRGIDLVVVGPEAPLVAGGADAAARVCSTEAEAEAALAEFGPPHVVKDDGLAAGKGVVVTDSREEALAHARACLGKPGGAVVIEEFLDGPEVSLFCLCDGHVAVPLQPAQDFKRAYDGGQGPNTGGMGAYSPLPWAPDDLAEDVLARVAQPVVDEMARRGTPFVGLLYCGLALTSRGLRVVEFNVRFGDPETQCVLARLVTPLAGLLRDAACGDLGGAVLAWSESSAVTVVLAAAGYPGAPRTGDPVRGLGEAEATDGAYVVHAGTEERPDGSIVSAGGRVLATVGIGPSVPEARDAAYAALRKINLEGAHFRGDIAADVHSSC